MKQKLVDNLDEANNLLAQGWKISNITHLKDASKDIIYTLEKEDYKYTIERVYETHEVKNMLAIYKNAGYVLVKLENFTDWRCNPLTRCTFGVTDKVIKTV